MKTKRLSKKLSLKKNTVVNLQNKELSKVQGGTLATRLSCLKTCYLCPTFGPECITNADSDPCC